MSACHPKRQARFSSAAVGVRVAPLDGPEASVAKKGIEQAHGSQVLTSVAKVGIAGHPGRTQRI